MLVKVRIENAYTDGHESERVVELWLDDDLEEDDLDDWWQEDVFNETGDGHGVDSSLGSYYRATIIEAPDPALVGSTMEWC